MNPITIIKWLYYLFQGVTFLLWIFGLPLNLQYVAFESRTICSSAAMGDSPGYYKMVSLVDMADLCHKKIIKFCHLQLS